MVRAGHPERAIAEFERVVRHQPGDLALATALAGGLVSAADAAVREGRYADALACLSAVVNWCDTRGDAAAATRHRASIERIEMAHLEAQLGLSPTPPSRSGTHSADEDIRDRARQARACVARGDAAGAARHLTADMAGGDPALLLAIAEIQLRGGQPDEGVASVERLLAHDPSTGDDVVTLGIELAAGQPDAGFLLVEMVADAWTAQSEWPKAIAAFELFIEAQPDYPPALVRLHALQAARSEARDDSRVVPFRVLPSAAAKSRSA